MMSKERSSIFGNEPDFDVSDFAVASTKRRPAPERAAVAAISNAAGFKSREGQGSPLEARQLWRTGRNAQINLKATQETISRMREISADQGWPLAVTLEKALDALDRELAASKN
jgi:hypothetical protein